MNASDEQELKQRKYLRETRTHAYLPAVLSAIRPFAWSIFFSIVATLALCAFVVITLPSHMIAVKQLEDVNSEIATNENRKDRLELMIPTFEMSISQSKQEIRSGDEKV